MSEDKIKLIYEQWLGNFISRDVAMSLIGEELEKETKHLNEVKIYSDGNLIGVFDNVTLYIDKTLT